MHACVFVCLCMCVPILSASILLPSLSSLFLLLCTVIPLVSNSQMMQEPNYFFIYAPYKPLTSTCDPTCLVGSLWDGPTFYHDMAVRSSAPFSGSPLVARSSRPVPSTAAVVVSEGLHSVHGYDRYSSFLQGSSRGPPAQPQLTTSHTSKSAQRGYQGGAEAGNGTQVIIEPSSLMVLDQPFLVLWNTTGFSSPPLSIEFYSGR